MLAHITASSFTTQGDLFLAYYHCSSHSTHYILYPSRIFFLSTLFCVDRSMSIISNAFSFFLRCNSDYHTPNQTEFVYKALLILQWEVHSCPCLLCFFSRAPWIVLAISRRPDEPLLLRTNVGRCWKRHPWNAFVMVASLIIKWSLWTFGSFPSPYFLEHLKVPFSLGHN